MEEGDIVSSITIVVQGESLRAQLKEERDLVDLLRKSHAEEKKISEGLRRTLDEVCDHTAKPCPSYS